MRQQTQPVVKSRRIRPPAQIQPKWKAILYAPATKVSIGLIIGIGLLFLTAQFVNIPKTLHILQETLTMPQGIALALLSGVAFLIAFAIRGVRWKLFLNPIGKVSTLKAIQLFLIGTFLNFLLPVRGGEVAKSLILKRITGIPMSQSLPTVAVDKSLDLLPAPFIMGILPFLGIQMDVQLWLILVTLNQSSVLAMSVFSHPLAALLLCSMGMLSLSALGMTISSATKLQKSPPTM